MTSEELKAYQNPTGGVVVKGSPYSTKYVIDILLTELSAERQRREEAEYFKRTHLCNIPNSQTVYYKNLAETLAAENENLKAKDFWAALSSSAQRTYGHLQPKEALEAIIEDHTETLAAENVQLLVVLKSYDGSRAYDIYDDDLLPSREWERKRVNILSAAAETTKYQKIIEAAKEHSECDEVNFRATFERLCQAVRALKGEN
jgi:hypothetical protein